MAGKFPGGQEFNVEEDAVSSQYVFTNWKTPVLFSGFEIGEKIKVGLPLIYSNAIQNSPVKDVFKICIPMADEDEAGRKSWDETAVLIAVKGYNKFYTLHYGQIQVAEDGSNTWNANGELHAYLVKNTSPQILQSYINKLIMHQPVK